MNTQKVAADFRISKWGGLVKERIASGQSISAFCEENGISKSTYYYRQRAVREAACMLSLMPTKSENAQHNDTTTQTAVVPAGWYKACDPIVTDHPDGTICEASVKEAVIVSVGGCKVSFDENTDTTLFLKVVQALGAIS